MPTKIKIYNQQADSVSEQEVSSKVFALKISQDLIHQAMVAQMSNERQVLAHTKTKGEVSGGGRKPWKQKGTGRARAGSSRSPIWIGGGVIFGPTKDRNFKKKINRKMKQKALCMAISDRTASGQLAVIDKFEISDFKTKIFDKIITGFEQKVFGKNELKGAQKTKADKHRSILLLNDQREDKIVNSARNLAGLTILNYENINLLDILKHKQLILTQGIAQKLSEQYSKIK
jgi:large subunit ribosomal protein L4